MPRILCCRPEIFLEILTHLKKGTSSPENRFLSSALYATRGCRAECTTPVSRCWSKKEDGCCKVQRDHLCIPDLLLVDPDLLRAKVIVELRIKFQDRRILHVFILTAKFKPKMRSPRA